MIRKLHSSPAPGAHHHKGELGLSACADGSAEPSQDALAGAEAMGRHDLEIHEIADHASSDLVDCSQIGSHNLGGEASG